MEFLYIFPVKLKRKSYVFINKFVNDADNGVEGVKYWYSTTGNDRLKIASICPLFVLSMALPVKPFQSNKKGPT